MEINSLHFEEFIPTKKGRWLNTKLSKNNKSGFKGVYWRENKKRWVVLVTFNNKKYHGGSFKELKEAVERQETLEKEIYSLNP